MPIQTRTPARSSPPQTGRIVISSGLYNDQFKYTQGVPWVKRTT